MRIFILLLFVFIPRLKLTAQVSFKAGWNTYHAGYVIHEYGYNMVFADSVKLFLTDSVQTFISADSLVIMSQHTPLHDISIYKTVYYLNARKLPVKKEEYKDEALIESNEWKYDDKGRKILQIEDNKNTGNVFRKTYEYSIDKKTRETIATESSYLNGKIEFYTRAYFDANNVKLKEVRLNDNNKDVVHIESYAYGENGKVRERTVYFPEWKVTKKFEEKEGNEVPACYKTLPVGTAEKVGLGNRIAYMKKLIYRNKSLLNQPECHEFAFTFTNFSTCEVIVATTNVNNGRKVTFRFREKF